MKTKRTPSLEKDWSDFLAVIPAENTAPPEGLLARVRSDLRAEVSRVLWKALLGHGVASLLILAICPQFDVGLFAAHTPLLHLFHQFGPIGCQLACGALYLGLVSLFTLGSLKRSELRLLAHRSRGRRAAIALGLSALTLAAYWVRSPEAVTSVPFGAWLLGASFSSLLSGEGLLRLRLRPVFAPAK